MERKIKNSALVGTREDCRTRKDLDNLVRKREIYRLLGGPPCRPSSAGRLVPAMGGYPGGGTAMMWWGGKPGGGTPGSGYIFSAE